MYYLRVIVMAKEKKDSRHQQEADKTVEATLRDIEKIQEAVDEHGLPLRVDNYGGSDVWTFDDKHTIKIEGKS